MFTRLTPLGKLGLIEWVILAAIATAIIIVVASMADAQTPALYPR